MPRIFDNQTELLAPALRDTLDQAVGLDACVGYLNLRGWRQIADQVEKLAGVPNRPPARVLVGMAARPEQQQRAAYRVHRQDEDNRLTLRDAAGLRDETLREFREQLVVGAPSNNDEQTLRRFRHQLSDGKVCVKFFARYPLHAKLYLVHLADGQIIPHLGFLGSSNLTFSGLVAQGELNIDVTEHDATQKLLTWFEDRWNDDLAVDVTEQLIELLDDSWASETQPDPYALYLKLAFELSSDAREGLRDYDIPASLRKVLLSHQADAVRVAARIVERRGGVMIGDVVGLGKTLIATAIARVMFEQHNTETLVICPKNLVGMWQDHLREYQVVGQVVPLSMVHAELPELARFRLVVVDESHNLRNSETRQWQAVRSYIERNDPRVVLLTATPYNKAFTDAAGQLRLWLAEDADVGIRPERAITEDGELSVAKRSDGRLSTLQAFEVSEFAEDWQRLMSLFLVRRTRRFIEEHYGEIDATGRRSLRFANGDQFYFPQRVPKPLPYDGGPGDPGDDLASPATVDQLNDLLLPRYRLGDFLVKSAEGSTKEEEAIIERMKKSRGNLQGFIRTSLMKRLASCGPSFLISIERHLLRNRVVAYAVENRLPVPIGTIEESRWDAFDSENLDGLDVNPTLTKDHTPAGWTAAAARRYASLERKPPVNLLWIDPDVFSEALNEALENDREILQAILDEHGPWDPTRDSKIAALVDLIATQHGEEKVLIFSEYADTTKYVAEQLARRMPGTAVGAVTGDTNDPTSLARRFSPNSNIALGGLPVGGEELRVLVATDVLSEGQNLQDAAIVVNYDLPWTIIRLIQRAGRVDRVGQASPIVRVYSFLPQAGVEQVIELRERIRRRLRENAEVFGSDEQFFEDDLSNENLASLFDGTGALTEDEGEEEVDWASQALAIWEAATEADQQRAANLPCVTYSTRPRREDDIGGTVVYTRTSSGVDGLAFTHHGPRGPESRVLTPYEALRVAQVEPGTEPVARRVDHHELVKRAVTTVLMDSARQPLAITHSGPRARLYKLLNSYREENAGTFADTPELRKLIERVLETPLRETAKHRIVRALRQRSPDDVVAFAIDLDDQGALLVDMDVRDDEIRIICSLGIPDP